MPAAKSKVRKSRARRSRSSHAKKTYRPCKSKQVRGRKSHRCHRKKSVHGSPRMTERQFYCVSCRARRTIQSEGICVKVYKNRKMFDGKAPALRAKCTCGTNLTKFVKHDAEQRLADKYGRCR